MSASKQMQCEFLCNSNIRGMTFTYNDRSPATVAELLHTIGAMDGMNYLLKDRDAGWRFEKAISRDRETHFSKTTPFMVTFGDAPVTKFDINSAIELGLRVVRFKMTALTESDKIKLVSLLNKAVTWCCEKYNVSTWPIALSADVPNACIRTGCLENKEEHPEGIMLKEDSIVEVTSDVEFLNKCNANRIFIDDPYTVPCLVPGTEISINFGSVVMISIEKINDQNVKCKVISGGMMSDQSFVCVRGIIHIKPALTEKDIEIIEFAKSLKFDIITINSVRIAQTVRRVRAMTTSYKPLLMSVICEQQGLDNIDSIIEASDGIILAGEFLAHEIYDKYKMITIQLYVSAKCRVLGKPLYLSGEILQNALLTGKSTICDINDITNAVLQRSGFVLRTFKDPVNLIKALHTLDDVCEVVEPLTPYDHQLMRISMEYKMPVNAARATVLSAVFLAKMTNSMVIIVPTVTGGTIKQVAHMSADNIIIAITSSPTVAKQLQLHKGVIPIVYDNTISIGRKMMPFNFIMEGDYNLNLLEDLDELETMTRRPRIFQSRRNFYEEYDEVSFKTRFRLSKSSAIHILGLIEEKLEFQNDKNNSLSPINQLLLTLRFYATGCHQLTMGDFCGVSRPTANRTIHRVTAAIASLNKHFIKFPQSEADIRKTQMEFYNIAKFPKVIGALDCTHVKIISPGGEHAETFRNRKEKPLKDWQDEMDARIKFAVAYGRKFKVLSRGSNYVLLKKMYPTTSYCDQVSACAALSDEDIIRLECTKRSELKKLDWDISNLTNNE